MSTKQPLSNGAIVAGGAAARERSGRVKSNPFSSKELEPMKKTKVEGGTQCLFILFYHCAV